MSRQGGGEVQHSPLPQQTKTKTLHIGANERERKIKNKKQQN